MGEAGLPMVTGVIIDKVGYLGLPYAVVLSACALIILYCAIHVTGTTPTPAAPVSMVLKALSIDELVGSVESTRKRQLVL